MKLLSVREQGDVGAGDTVELIDRDEKSVTIAEFIEPISTTCTSRRS
jgi:hypothetical protein